MCRKQFSSNCVNYILAIVLLIIVFTVKLAILIHWIDCIRGTDEMRNDDVAGAEVALNSDKTPAVIVPKIRMYEYYTLFILNRWL